MPASAPLARPQIAPTKSARATTAVGPSVESGAIFGAEYIPWSLGCPEKTRPQSGCGSPLRSRTRVRVLVRKLATARMRLAGITSASIGCTRHALSDSSPPGRSRYHARRDARSSEHCGGEAQTGALAHDHAHGIEDDDQDDEARRASSVEEGSREGARSAASSPEGARGEARTEASSQEGMIAVTEGSTRSR